MSGADEASKKPAEDQDDGDYFYVCKRALEGVQASLKKGEEITQEAVNELAFPDDLADDEMMVPVDMTGAGGEYEDVEQMVEKLGPKGAAEAFVKAFEHFEKTKEKIPEEERPKPMTAKEWKSVLEPDMEGEEEELEDEEEEDGLSEGEEEEDDGEAAAEPASKKAKTK
mmetsp:Transcript_105363/g.255822  ORF Transcript_105363/g.255822 Transcript_105363/m.255822 type:complete len:169 (-) Transcript_105363:382-888(-)